MLFSAYLNPNTLLYVWDNYIIGLDTPGFSTEWLAIVLVTILALTKDKIKEATSVSFILNKCNFHVLQINGQ